MELSALLASRVTSESFSIVLLNNTDTTSVFDIDANSSIVDCNWCKHIILRFTKKIIMRR